VTLPSHMPLVVVEPETRKRTLARIAKAWF
jgi:hypothetical protein